MNSQLSSMTGECIIFSDLDRTIIPNGPQPESSEARSLLRQLASQNAVKLAYVSGRSQNLIKEAIVQYNLPVPDFAVGDVGTTIYCIGPTGWEMMGLWQQKIAASWQGYTAARLADILAPLNFLTLQESEKQSRFKLSYYIDVGGDHVSFAQGVVERLKESGVGVEVICSIDETENRAFLDVLPANASKLHAVRFLIGHVDLYLNRAVFCGDSGNDLPVLASEIQSVLVGNATDEIRAEATRQSLKSGHGAKLYLAKGFGRLNGNYSAGVLEGTAHFLPEVKDWLKNLGLGD